MRSPSGAPGFSLHYLRAITVIHQLGSGRSSGPHTIAAALPGSDWGRLPWSCGAAWPTWDRPSSSAGHSSSPSTRYHLLTHRSICPLSISYIYLPIPSSTALIASFAQSCFGRGVDSIANVCPCQPHQAHPGHHHEGQLPSISPATTGGWLAGPRRHHP